MDMDDEDEDGMDDTYRLYNIDKKMGRIKQNLQ